MYDASQIISERIRQLVESSGSTYKDLADNIGVNKATISRFVTQTRVPDLTTAVKIASCYKVSLDWLCGLSDDKHADDGLSELCSLYPTFDNTDKAIVSLLMSKYKKDKSDETSN